MDSEKILQIAKVAYEANRSYCETIGDYSFGPWETAPGWQKNTNINGVKFHLAVLELGGEPTPSASHDSWLREKAETGWKYGPVKDPVKKEHPCFVPYDQLPAEQQMKDHLFIAIVRAFL